MPNAGVPLATPPPVVVCGAIPGRCCSSLFVTPGFGAERLHRPIQRRDRQHLLVFGRRPRCCHRLRRCSSRPDGNHRRSVCRTGAGVFRGDVPFRCDRGGRASHWRFANRRLRRAAVLREPAGQRAADLLFPHGRNGAVLRVSGGAGSVAGCVERQRLHVSNHSHRGCGEPRQRRRIVRVPRQQRAVGALESVSARRRRVGQCHAGHELGRVRRRRQPRRLRFVFRHHALAAARRVRSHAVVLSSAGAARGGRGALLARRRARRRGARIFGTHMAIHDAKRQLRALCTERSATAGPRNRRFDLWISFVDRHGHRWRRVALRRLPRHVAVSAFGGAGGGRIELFTRGACARHPVFLAGRRERRDHRVIQSNLDLLDRRRQSPAAAAVVAATSQRLDQCVFASDADVGLQRSGWRRHVGIRRVFRLHVAPAARGDGSDDARVLARCAHDRRSVFLACCRTRRSRVRNVGPAMDVHHASGKLAAATSQQSPPCA